MELPIYQVDAFTSEQFGGNPAAVVPLQEPIEDQLMQSIANENNLPETAFFYPVDAGYHLRWFTPEAEVPLCGHATLASAAIIFEFLEPEKELLTFETMSGVLRVSKYEGGYELDFPVMELSSGVPDETLVEALGKRPIAFFDIVGDVNLMAVYEDESDVQSLKPDIAYLKTLSGKGVIVTAESDNRHVDFVSRYFVPSMGIDEDPVTGSIHCALTPYWSGKLNESKLRARQLSRRGGSLECELVGDRVLIRGQTALYLKGWISV